MCDRKYIYPLGRMTLASTLVRGTFHGNNNIFPLHYLSALSELLYHWLVCVVFNCVCLFWLTLLIQSSTLPVSVSVSFSLNTLNRNSFIKQTRNGLFLPGFLPFLPPSLLILDAVVPGIFRFHPGQGSHMTFSLCELPPADHKVAQLHFGRVCLSMLI